MAKTNKLLLFSLLLGTTLLLLGTSYARSTTPNNRKFDTNSDTSKANFDFDSGTEWATVNCTNVTCDKLLDNYWTWYVLGGGVSTNNAQLASIDLNGTGLMVLSDAACQLGDRPTSLLEKDSRNSNSNSKAQKRGRRSYSYSSSKRSAAPDHPTPVHPNTDTEKDIQQPIRSAEPSLIQNKVRKNRKLRQQTAYSAIYSSFLDIDIDFDTDFDFDFDSDIDTDTDFGAESQTQTQINAGRRSGSRSSLSERAAAAVAARAGAGAGGEYYPSYNITNDDLLGLIVFQTCWVAHWMDYYGTNAYDYYSLAEDFCENSILPYFAYPNARFPNTIGFDNLTYRSVYLNNWDDYIFYPAYEALGCTW